MVKSKLALSKPKISQARKFSKDIIGPVQKFIDFHTTDTIERATLRLLGADGADSNGVPTANIIVRQCAQNIPDGASRYYLNALAKLGLCAFELNKRIVDGLNIFEMEFTDKKYIEKKAKEVLA
ncbi:MAG: lysine 5,6-aminomutase subunit alpha, partial [Elusimicrobiota bacterium]|nr:lysine 5,6-aminomutase subunit alpha [Elusimicrobiota bacterium]